jgi:hypothetical protein
MCVWECGVCARILQLLQTPIVGLQNICLCVSYCVRVSVSVVRVSECVVCVRSYPPVVADTDCWTAEHMYVCVCLTVCV